VSADIEPGASGAPLGAEVQAPTVDGPLAESSGGHRAPRAPMPESSGTRPAADAEAIALACLDRGDSKAALIILMKAYGDVVLSHCLRVLRERSLAEDIRQQVFLEAYRDLPRFQRRSTVRSWLLGIASHRCLDAIKARRRRDARFDSGEEEAVVLTPDGSPDPADHVDQERMHRVLETCLEALSGEVRMTVLMKFQMGLSYEEMGPMVGQRAGTLQARVARALPVLRRCLESKGVTL
jgi:RNA polymerase sigma-70 factor (ECF subfamily)